MSAETVEPIRSILFPTDFSPLRTPRSSMRNDLLPAPVPACSFYTLNKGKKSPAPLIWTTRPDACSRLFNPACPVFKLSILLLEVQPEKSSAG